MMRAAEAPSSLQDDGFGMGGEIVAAGGARACGSSDQAVRQVSDIDRAEPALSAGDLQNQALGNGFQELKYIGIARPVHHRAGVR